VGGRAGTLQPVAEGESGKFISQLVEERLLAATGGQAVSSGEKQIKAFDELATALFGGSAKPA
jgi:hypothetical protein